MKRIYSTDNPALAWHVRNMLHQQGIQAEVRNEKLYSIVGETPPSETWPEVWVARQQDHAQAEKLVKALLENKPVEYEDWSCPGCGESVAGSMAVCWNCGTPAHE